MNYLKSVFIEVGNITWTPRVELLKLTSKVIALIFCLIIYIFCVDSATMSIMSFMMNLIK